MPGSTFNFPTNYLCQKEDFTIEWFRISFAMKMNTTIINLQYIGVAQGRLQRGATSENHEFRMFPFPFVWMSSASEDCVLANDAMENYLFSIQLEFVIFPENHSFVHIKNVACYCHGIFVPAKRCVLMQYGRR